MLIYIEIILHTRPGQTISIWLLLGGYPLRMLNVVFQLSHLFIEQLHHGFILNIRYHNC